MQLSSLRRSCHLTKMPFQNLIIPQLWKKILINTESGIHHPHQVHLPTCEPEHANKPLDETSLIVMNEKSHVIHAPRLVRSGCAKRSCCTVKRRTFEVLSGSSLVDTAIQTLAEVLQDFKLCQRKACLAAIERFFKMTRFKSDRTLPVHLRN